MTGAPPQSHDPYLPTYSHTKDEGGKDEVGKTEAQDAGERLHVIDWRTRASPQYNPINKDTEYPHHMEDSKAVEKVTTLINKLTGSLTTTGTCVTLAGLTCHGGTPARRALKNAAGQGTRRTGPWEL